MGELSMVEKFIQTMKYTFWWFCKHDWKSIDDNTFQCDKCWRIKQHGKIK